MPPDSARLIPRNLYRYEHHRYQAWAVQITRRGRLVVRYFADRQYGSRDEALASAVAFRDRLLQKLPPLVFAGLRPRSTTGVVGVRVQVDHRPQGVYRSYVASWWDASDKRVTRTFAFKKFGKQRAFDLAVRARQRALAEILRPLPRPDHSFADVATLTP